MTLRHCVFHGNIIERPKPRLEFAHQVEIGRSIHVVSKRQRLVNCLNSMRFRVARIGNIDLASVDENLTMIALVGAG